MGFFSKKDKAAEAADESARSSLFGNRSTPQPTQNPYSAAAPPPPYQQQANSRSAYNQPPPSVASTDRKRDELFSGRQQAPASAYGAPNAYQTPSAAPSNAYGQPAPAGGSGTYGSNSYGADTTLSAEQEEEEDVEAVKQQIRFTKQESVSSTRNALRVAAQAEETGRATLARLGQQGERLYNTEKNLDVAATHNRVAEERARELKSLNRGMFVPHINNPMKSKSRAAAEEARILDRHQEDRDERERTRQHGYEGREFVDRTLNGQAAGPAKTKMSLAERTKYQFEADESDDEKETEINNNLDQLAGITQRLHGLAVATGQEVSRQNTQIDGIMKKVSLRIMYGQGRDSNACCRATMSTTRSPSPTTDLRGLDRAWDVGGCFLLSLFFTGCVDDCRSIPIFRACIVSCLPVDVNIMDFSQTLTSVACQAA